MNFHDYYHKCLCIECTKTEKELKKKISLEEREKLHQKISGFSESQMVEFRKARQEGLSTEEAVIIAERI